MSVQLAAARQFSKSAVAGRIVIKVRRIPYQIWSIGSARNVMKESIPQMQCDGSNKHHLRTRHEPFGDRHPQRPTKPLERAPGSARSSITIPLDEQRSCVRAEENRPIDAPSKKQQSPAKAPQTTSVAPHADDYDSRSRKPDATAQRAPDKRPKDCSLDRKHGSPQRSHH